MAPRSEEQRPLQAPQFGAPAAVAPSAEFSRAEITVPHGLESMGEPAAIEPQVLAAPEFRPAPPSPAPEVRLAPPPPAPEVRLAPPPPPPDPVEIDRALRESGLEMVQTRADSHAAPSPEPEFVPAKRERRAPPPDLAEPLVQVETGGETALPKD